MIPHPETMRYLWEEEVQSPTRVVLTVILLTIFLMVGSHFLVVLTTSPGYEIAEVTGDR